MTPSSAVFFPDESSIISGTNDYKKTIKMKDKSQWKIYESRFMDR